MSSSDNTHAQKMNLKYDGFQIISSTSPLNGELMGFRNDISVPIPEQTVLNQMIKLINHPEPTTYALSCESCTIKKSLFAYHNPTLLTMNVSFTTLPWSEDDSLEYHISITPLLLSNMAVRSTPSMKDANLTVSHPVNLNADPVIDRYAVSHNGEQIHFTFNAHYGSKVVVGVIARSGPNVIREETLLVEAPEGEVYIPVPKFVQPLKYKYDESGTTKFTFQTNSSYQVVKFQSDDPVTDLIRYFYDGSNEQSQYWRLYYHRDVPLFKHNKIGDIPLLDFVQKMTLVYYAMGKEPGFHWYLDEERPCIERMNRSNDILVRVSTQGGEFRRWVNTPPLPSPEGEESLISSLKAIAPRARYLWGAFHLVGYNAEEGDDVVIRTLEDNPTIQLRVINCDNNFETRIVTARESDPLETFLVTPLAPSGPVMAYLSTFGADVVKIKNPQMTCKEAGITWNATIGRELLGDRPHSDPVSLEKECTWNTIWTFNPRDPAFSITIETPYAKSVTFRAWKECPVLLLKLFINAKEGIPLTKQRIYLEDKRLDDHQTLGFYHVGLGAILYLSLGNHLVEQN